MVVEAQGGLGYWRQFFSFGSYSMVTKYMIMNHIIDTRLPPEIYCIALDLQLA